MRDSIAKAELFVCLNRTNPERWNERKFIQLTIKWKYDGSSAGYGLELFFHYTKLD